MNARSGAGLVAAIAMVGLIGCAPTGAITFQRAGQPLTLLKPGLYPETIEYDSRRDKFLVGSFRQGAVYQVDDDGRTSVVVDDNRLCSVLGIAVDVQRNRLWLVNADVGAGLRPSAAGPKNLAAVGIYDLSTGAAIDYIDLTTLSPGPPHLLNGIAVDRAGNAYVTDSFSPTIYRIDARGNASVFLRDQQFAGTGINLNGLAVHPDGYLLVIKKSDGALFKVPLTNPSGFGKVDVGTRFVGGDGLTLVGKKDLVVIANQIPGITTNAAFALHSDDGWNTAKLRAVQQLADVYPTTGVLRQGQLYVVSSKLNELIEAPPEQKARLLRQATIQKIGDAR